MKKLLLCAAISGLTAVSVQAQSETNKVSMVRAESRPSFGIRAGVNFQNINGKDAGGTELKNDLLTGFNGGVNVELPLSSGFYLQPGLLFSRKGAEWSNGNKIKLSYLELPVNFIYKPILGSGNMLLGFGPYFAYGVGGKIKYTNGATGDIEFDKNFDPNNGSTQFKKVDAGGNLLVGYEFARKLALQLNAQLGMVNIRKDNPTNSNDQTKWKNTGFGVSLGYRF